MEADAASDTSDVDRFGEDFEGGCEIPLVEHTEIPSWDQADALQVTLATLEHVYAGLTPHCVCLDVAHRVCTPGHRLLSVAICSAAVAHMQLVPASPIWASPPDTPAASTPKTELVPTTVEPAFMPYTRVCDLVHGTIPGSGSMCGLVIASARCECVTMRASFVSLPTLVLLAGH